MPVTAAGGGEALRPRLNRAFFKGFARWHTRLLVRTRGRPSRLGRQGTFLVLETTGRRSGQARSVVLLFMAEGDGFVVLASNYGQEHPPAWWRNLEAHPDAMVHLSGRSTPVRARALSGDERQAVVARAVQYNTQWRGYVETLRRELPVVLLEPASPGLTSRPSPPA